MKEKIYRSFMGLVVAGVLTFTGCEAGLGQNDSGSDSSEGFSFSEIYSNINAMQEEIESLKKTNEEQLEMIEALQISVVPVGSITALEKTIDGSVYIPEGWAECNGQVVSDVDSLFYGETVPNLNGENRFLRGQAGLSSATDPSVLKGGTTTHTHSFTQTSVDLAPDASGDTSGAYTNPANHLPPYYSVTWIIRIK
ncbi:MAG: tail fiber protein [bacterium]|nr:tail fiber protein [bacterium]